MPWGKITYVRGREVYVGSKGPSAAADTWVKDSLTGKLILEQK